MSSQNDEEMAEAQIKYKVTRFGQHSDYIQIGKPTFESNLFSFTYVRKSEISGQLLFINQHDLHI